jgi:hypothetical protein
MLLSKEVEISVLNNNRSYLESKGYDTSNNKVTIKVSDLLPNSKTIVIVKCDICGTIKENSYFNYNKSLGKFGLYTCSSKCSNIKKKKTNLEKNGTEWASQSEEIKEKIKKTNLEKYGTLNGISDAKKEEIKKTNILKYGVSHPQQLDEIKEKIKKTNLEKYGVEYVFQSDKIKEKIKKTNLEKYGVDNPMKSDIFKLKSEQEKEKKYNDKYYNNREKYKETSYNKWGKIYTQTDEYKQKTKKTNLEKYGVEYIFKSDEIRKKIKESKLSNWGNINFNNIEKTKKTNLEKYGVEYVFQSDEIKEKIKETNLKKYGIETILKLDSIVELRNKSYHIKNKEYVINTYSNLIKPEYKIVNYISNELLIEHNNHSFLISRNLLYDRLIHSKYCEICTICNPINSNSSAHENEIVEWLSQYVDIETRNRKILNGQELDIYIPSEKIAIEFNGLYWHSELFKDKWYHYNKTKNCQKLDIKLIHIFEDDWIHKKDIIKSIILNKLKIQSNKIWARKCLVKQIPYKEAKEFLNKNHIQGYSKSKYKLGLFYMDKLVSVMTFGYRKTNSKSEFELIRFCNILNTNVIGGASKLLNFFIKKFNYSGTIVSYADLSIFDGKLYENMGFNFKHISKPNYYWVVNKIRYHRFKYNKKKLVKNYGSDIKKTEVEIMNEWGHYRIWSCGQSRYELII